jgi:anaerobic dimethyl sulfoxide reductase subunit B (iron-sulfur subunit)
VAYLAQPCYHCEDPACVPACPVSAISKREEDGIVVVDRDVCMGNEDCEVHCKNACPYDSPGFGPEKGAKMQKCDLCLDRWGEDKAPICVEACPMLALDAGPLDQLKSKFKGMATAEGFVGSEDLKPSAIFKPKKK